MKQLRIGYLSTFYHTSHIIKRLEWIEKFIAFKPEWSLFGTGPSMVEAFRGGLLDLGYTGLPPAMIGMGKGLPLKCIGGGHIEGTVMIAQQGTVPVKQRGEIKACLQQFEGTQIGSPSKGSIHDVILRDLVKRYGVQRIRVKNYSWADLIPEAITDGEIAGAVGTPPLAVLAHRWYGHAVVIPPAYLWPFNPSYGIVVQEDMLDEADILEQFLMLHEKACNFIIRKPHEAARVLADEVKVVDEAFILEILSVSPRYCASIPQEYIDATTAFLPVLQQMGYLGRNLYEDDIFELSIIKKVHPEPHHYFALFQVTPLSS